MDHRSIEDGLSASFDPVRFPLSTAVARALETRSIPLALRSPPTDHRPAVFHVHTDRSEWECLVEVHEDRELVAFRSFLPFRIPPERIEPVAALAAHLNATRLVGHFALAYDEGVVTHVLAARFDGIEPTADVLVWMLGENLLGLDLHFAAFALVTHGGLGVREVAAAELAAVGG